MEQNEKHVNNDDSQYLPQIQDNIACYFSLWIQSMTFNILAFDFYVYLNCNSMMDLNFGLYKIVRIATRVSTSINLLLQLLQLKKQSDNINLSIVLKRKLLFVLVIGNNLGLHNTVTDGIISAIGRAQASHTNEESGGNNETTNINELKLSNNRYLPFIQTNAAINQGSSSGPLIDLNGKLIGINTAIASFGINIGIGFAIPSNYVLLLLKSLNEPYIYNEPNIYVAKIFINNNNNNNNNNYIEGVKIIDIHTQSPAKLSGIKYNDILIMINKNIKINSQDKYWMTLNSFQPNEMNKIKMALKYFYSVLFVQLVINNIAPYFIYCIDII